MANAEGVEAVAQEGDGAGESGEDRHLRTLESS